jgi:Protein of unknown function (DUF3800)
MRRWKRAAIAHQPRTAGDGLNVGCPGRDRRSVEISAACGASAILGPQSRGPAFSDRGSLVFPRLILVLKDIKSYIYLLYVDESGTTHDPDQQYFVLAGFCVFERQGYWISNQLDQIAARFDPADPATVELHGSPMFGGRGRWRSHPKEERHQAIEDALRVFLQSHPTNRLFASVIKKSVVSPRDPVEAAFEQLASRFDKYLMRLHRNGDTHRGIIIFDKSTYETTIQSLATDFRTIGYT